MDESELARLRDEVQALRRELECLKESLKRGLMQVVKGVDRASTLTHQEPVLAAKGRQWDDELEF
jgi:hypothetical protein